MATPFPPSGQFLNSIRESARQLRTKENISITPENIQRLLRSPAFLDSYQRVSKIHGLALPLNFSSTLDELNFLSILSLLNFASGYRVPLHVQTGRGAWDSIRALLFSLYITSTGGDEGDLLSARGLRAITTSKVAEFMNINLHVERPHESIPGVVVGELGGPLYELVKLIVSVLNETGEILVNGGYANLGDFVVKALKSSSGDADFLDSVVEKLVRAFPGFRDMSTVNGQPIYCFKKALFLIHAITIRFGALSPPPFPIPKTENVPVFSDNVLPSMLIHLGVIDLAGAPALARLFPGAGSPKCLETLLAAAPLAPPKASSTAQGQKKSPPKEGPLITHDQGYILRAAAIDACELIVQAARSPEPGQMQPEWLKELTLPDLDMWIWSVAKDRADYRALERFAEQDTVYF